MSAAISTTGVLPLFSSQCVVSFPTASISPLEWFFVPFSERPYARLINETRFSGNVLDLSGSTKPR